MKYCGIYSNKIDVSVFDELNIIYQNQDRQLVDFLQKHINQKINLIIQDINSFEENQEWLKLNAIHEKYPDLNFKICFGQLQKFQEVSDILQHCIENLKIPFFTGYLVTNFDQLNHLCSFGISEVYLGEDICFDLKRARAVCDRYKIRIRAFPNVGQSSIKSSPALKKFFIRPEDVEEYSDVIDVFEFWGPLDRQNVLYKIYSKGVWFGDLNDLLLDCDLHFDSRRIVPGFAQIRKTCGRKCMKGEHCSICDKIYNISEKLADKNLIIKKKKID